MSNTEGSEKVIAGISDENWQAVKVLVVDDDDRVQEQFKMYFTDLGIDHYQFECSAAAAMSNMVQQQHSYDLVVTDLNMPNVDGITFMRFLSKIEYSGALMIISGEDRRLLNSVVQLGNAHNLNIIGAMQKPFDRTELRQMFGKMQLSADKLAFVSADQSLTEDEIQQGLSRGNPELYFQPKVAVKTMSVPSFEALARWRAEDGKILGPHLFIPVAEQSALINDLTDQVFIKSVEQVAQWHGQGFMFAVAVNFSMNSLERISLPDTLLAICSDYKVSPENITIEITETCIMNQEAVALDVITRLHLKGFRLSIDDFGTGYSSIEKLNRLPFSEIKIDRAFVDGAANSYSSRAILESSIAMGKKMGISIVSEGVETEQDFELLKELGADYVQGALFSNPIPADSVLQWVENWNKSSH
ncbi:MAG: EAL domain-containing response regulator [Gammaproteobacteria bacterium]|nr:EAL domain-containing response regulator [Gammaproteobacteria bacterium]